MPAAPATTVVLATPEALTGAETAVPPLTEKATVPVGAAAADSATVAVRVTFWPVVTDAGTALTDVVVEAVVTGGLTSFTRQAVGEVKVTVSPWNSS